MEILFTGTGAADWELLPEDKMESGMRRYSSLVLDGKIFIDLAPQSVDYARNAGVDLSSVKAVFISHTHDDHYSKQALLALGNATCEKIKIFCHSDAVGALCLSEKEAEKFEIIPLSCFDDVVFCDYKITPMPANHLVENSPETCLHYVFEKDGKKLFYGCDGGWFCAETWEYMRNLCFDGMIFDATVGESDCDYRLGTHNSIPMLRIIVASLRENRMIKSDSVLIANHLAKTLHAPEAETRETFKNMGMLTAYDGFTVSI